MPAPSPGSTCLVTGASSGIGAELARGLAERGHGVTLCARREGRLTQLAEELAGEHGIRAETVALDVTDTHARGELVIELDERGLTVEVLINNAGFGSGGAFVDLDPNNEAAMVRTNVEALIAMTGAFLPGMVERGRGAILNLASLIAFQPVPFQATYGATKAAVLSFSDALHEEVRGKGVTVTSVCPGPVRTEFGEAGGFGGADEDIPARFWLDPGKVAADALEALEKGDRITVPGVRNQILALYGQHMPRFLLLPLLRRIYPVGD